MPWRVRIIWPILRVTLIRKLVLLDHLWPEQITKSEQASGVSPPDFRISSLSGVPTVRGSFLFEVTRASELAGYFRGGATGPGMQPRCARRTGEGARPYTRRPSRHDPWSNFGFEALRIIFVDAGMDGEWGIGERGV
jgi:hypothetical protein